MYKIEITTPPPSQKEKKIHKHFKLRKKNIYWAVFGNILFLFFILIRDKEAKMRW